MAVQGDAAADRGREAAADREPETGSAVLPRRRVVDLPEILEHLLVILDRDADPGVADRNRRQAFRS